jgi:mRNA interferase YafQ
VAAAGGPSPRRLLTTQTFVRDLKRLLKQGKDQARLDAVVNDVRNRRPLPARMRDHPLKGDWKGFRECHVGADWLLSYRTDEDSVTLARSGSHAELFG